MIKMYFSYEKYFNLQRYFFVNAKRKPQLDLTGDSNRYQETYSVKTLEKNNSDLVGKTIINFTEKFYQNLISKLRLHGKNIIVIAKSCILP